MEISHLKRLRKVVPGGAFLLFSIPAAYLYATHVSLNLTNYLNLPIMGLGVVVAYVIGAVFDGLKIRSIRTDKSYKHITDNIKLKLIEYGLTIKIDRGKIEEIKSSRKLLDIFYYFIDNDESLKEKSKLVKDNGLMWTSTADIAILGCFFCWLYFMLSIFLEPKLLLVLSGLVVGFIGFISGVVLHPIFVKKHIDLGNEQIEFIVTNKKNDLQDKVTGLFEEDE